MSNSGTNKHKIDSGASEGARRATEQSPESAAGGAGRWSSKRKLSVVLELLRGADIESVSRKHRINVATLTDWKERFLNGAECGLKTREAEPENEDNRRLKSVVANLSVENELLREKIARMENGRPFVSWKSKG
jgi:Transposase